MQEKVNNKINAKMYGSSERIGACHVDDQKSLEKLKAQRAGNEMISSMIRELEKVKRIVIRD